MAETDTLPNTPEDDSSGSGEDTSQKTPSNYSEYSVEDAARRLEQAKAKREAANQPPSPTDEILGRIEQMLGEVVQQKTSARETASPQAVGGAEQPPRPPLDRQPSSPDRPPQRSEDEIASEPSAPTEPEPERRPGAPIPEEVTARAAQLRQETRRRPDGSIGVSLEDMAFGDFDPEELDKLTPAERRERIRQLQEAGRAKMKSFEGGRGFYSLYYRLADLLEADPSGQSLRDFVYETVSAAEADPDKTFETNIMQELLTSLSYVLAEKQGFQTELKNIIKGRYKIHQAALMAKYVNGDKQGELWKDMYQDELEAVLHAQMVLEALGSLESNDGDWYRKGGAPMLDRQINTLLKQTDFGIVRRTVPDPKNPNQTRTEELLVRLEKFDNPDILKRAFEIIEELRKDVVKPGTREHRTTLMRLDHSWEDEPETQEQITQRLKNPLDTEKAVQKLIDEKLITIEQANEMNDILIVREALRTMLEGRANNRVDMAPEEVYNFFFEGREMPQWHKERMLRILIRTRQAFDTADKLCFAFNVAGYSDGAIDNYKEALLPVEARFPIPTDPAVFKNMLESEALKEYARVVYEDFGELPEKDKDITKDTQQTKLEALARDLRLRELQGHWVNLYHIHQDAERELEAIKGGQPTSPDRIRQLIAMEGSRRFRARMVGVAWGRAIREHVRDFWLGGKRAAETGRYIDLNNSCNGRGGRESRNETWNPIAQEKSNSREYAEEGLKQYAACGAMSYPMLSARKDIPDAILHWNDDYAPIVKDGANRLTLARDLHDKYVEDGPHLLKSPDCITNPVKFIKEALKVSMSKNVAEEEWMGLNEFLLEGFSNVQKRANKLYAHIKNFNALDLAWQYSSAVRAGLFRGDAEDRLIDNNISRHRVWALFKIGSHTLELGWAVIDAIKTALGQFKDSFK